MGKPAKPTTADIGQRGDAVNYRVDAKKPRHYILTVSCPDAVGLVAAVSSLIASWDGWLTEVANHADRVTGRFFMRNEVAADSLAFGIDEFRERFAPLAEKHRMRFEVRDSAVPRRVMILVSRQEHCLADLLHRWRTRELDFDLRGVISNHEQLRSFVEWHDVPYHHIPVSAESQGDGLRLDRRPPRGRGRRPRDPGPLHADPASGPVRPVRGSDRQHPPQLPPVLRRGPVPTSRPAPGG